MFSLACNLMIFRKNFLAKKPCGCNLIRSNQRAGSANTLKHFHMEKLSKWDIKMTRYQRWRPKMPVSTSLWRLKDVCLIWVPVKASLWRAKLISFTEVPVGTSLRRLKSVGFIYVPVKHHKDVSNRSDELTYQLRRHDDVSAWFEMFKLVTKMVQFLLRTMQ